MRRGKNQVRDIGAKMKPSKKVEEVNRVEVIDDSGRAYVKWEDWLNVDLSYQDNGKTLKIFVTTEDTKESSGKTGQLEDI